MLLTVDQGNTAIKWGLFEADRLERSGRVQNPEELLGSLPHARLERIVVSSVVPSRLAALCEALKGPAAPPVEVAGTDFPIPIENLCDPPERVGTDRLLNALAAHARVREACVVVDAGSAITVDAADAAGRFLGGAITAGPRLAALALHEHTDQLPLAPVILPGALPARDTVSAIRAGVFWGSVGAITELIRQMWTAFGVQAPVVATGGFADVLRRVAAVTHLDPDLTLRGLRLAAEASPRPTGHR